MNDEHEVEGVVLLDAIEDEHRLHGEMPWPRSVGCRYDHGDASHDEGYQSAHQIEMARRFEALEGEIIVQEVAQPDAQGEGDVKRHVSHALQRDYSLPESAQRSFHLIIYSQLLEQHVSQEEYGDAADGSNQISSGCEVAQDAVHTRARLVEEVQEDGNLHQEHQSCDEQYEQRVDGSLGYHGAQCFRKRNAVPSLQHGTSCKFTRAGDDEAQGIREEYGVDAYAAARLLADGFQRLLPSPSSEELRRDTEGERQQHPGPAHLVEQYLLHLLEVESAIHPIEDGTAQKQGECHLPNIVCYLFLFHHSCKGNTFIAYMALLSHIFSINKRLGSFLFPLFYIKDEKKSIQGVISRKIIVFLQNKYINIV